MYKKLLIVLCRIQRCIFSSLSIEERKKYLQSMKTTRQISLSDSSNCSDSEDDDWIPSASQSGDEYSDIDQNGI